MLERFYWSNIKTVIFYTVSNVQAQPLGCPLEQATGVRNRVTGRTQRLRFLIWYQKCKKKFLVNQLASSWNAVYLVFGARGSHVEVAEVVGSGLVSGWAHFEAGAPDQNVQLGQRWQKMWQVMANGWFNELELASYSLISQLVKQKSVPNTVPHSRHILYHLS